jgi:enterochelin esterase-like enzyme
LVAWLRFGVQSMILTTNGVTGFRALLGVFALATCGWGGSVQAGDAPEWVTAPVAAPNVSQQVFFSAAVGAPVSYHVYLPDAYATQPQRRFPVLYWLHGSNSVLTGIAPVSAYFDAAIDAGRIPSLILVFANGLPQGMWCDAESGLQPVESMVVDDLLPEVDARFRTLSQASARLVEGFSMGGYGAARLALLYPDRFGAASMLGAGPLQLDFLVDDPNLQPIEVRQRILAEVYGNSPAVFEARSPWRLAEQYPPAPGYRLRQIIGTLDFTLGPNRDFQAHLDELGIAHNYIEVPNVGHSVPGIINTLGDGFWAFHREALRDVDSLLADGFE